MDEELKTQLITEEIDACDTPLNARIHQVDLQPETELELEAETRKVWAKYSDVFKNYEEAEYFSMLPLSTKDRHEIIKRAKDIQRNSMETKKYWNERE